jgi:hypothetical protein
MAAKKKSKKKSAARLSKEDLRTSNARIGEGRDR